MRGCVAFQSDRFAFGSLVFSRLRHVRCFQWLWHFAIDTSPHLLPPRCDGMMNPGRLIGFADDRLVNSWRLNRFADDRIMNPRESELPCFEQCGALPFWKFEKL